VVFCVLLSKDETLLFSGGGDNLIMIWDTASGEEQARLKGHKGSVYTLRRSYNSQFIYSGSYDHLIMKWDIIRGRAVETFRGFYTYLTSLIFSKNEEVIYSLDSENSSFIKYIK
jgi:WD40 repeat protein